jgi:hypothetical protein
MCGNRLYAWKTIPDTAANPVDVHPRRRDLVTLDDDAPLVHRLQQVDAAEQRRLPGAGGADEADDLVAVEREVDSLQHLGAVEGLVQPLHERSASLAHRTPPSASWRRRSRITSQSVRRASGIVRRMKRSAVTR